MDTTYIHTMTSHGPSVWEFGRDSYDGHYYATNRRKCLICSSIGDLRKLYLKMYNTTRLDGTPMWTRGLPPERALSCPTRPVRVTSST